MNILKDFVVVDSLRSQSASTSNIWFLRNVISDKLYVMKIFLIAADQEESVVLHEKRIYQIITKSLIWNGVRNFVPLRGHGILTLAELEKYLLTSNAFKISSRALRANFRHNMNALVLDALDSIIKLDSSRPVFDDPLPDGLSSFIITPFVDGLTFDKIALMPDLKPRQLNTIMAELLLSTYILSRNYNLTHGDIHLENIFISDVFSPRDIFVDRYLIVFNNRVYSMRNKLTPYIYDFDRGTIKGEKNPLPDFLSDAGNCNLFFKNQDIGKLICGFNSIIKKRIEEGLMPPRTYNQVMSRITPYIKSDAILRRFKMNDTASFSCWLGELCGPESNLIDAEGLLTFFLKQTCENIPYYELTSRHPFVQDLLSQVLEIEVDVGNIYKTMLENIVFVRKVPREEIYQHVETVVRKAITNIEPNL